MKKDIIKINTNSIANGKYGNGVSIWINGRWILDASCFTKDFKIRIDTERVKVFKINKLNKKITYKWDKRFKK